MKKNEVPAGSIPAPSAENEFYKKIPGWLDYENIYSYVVEEAVGDCYFIELGSWFGRSACYMATEIKNSGKNIKFDAIDYWLPGLEHTPEQIALVKQHGSILESWKHFMREAGVEQYVTPIKEYSYLAARRYQDASVDFVWVDADHSREVVYEDLKAWMPKLKLGGIIAGHDYPSYGVREGVIEYFTKHFKQMPYIYTDKSSWMCQPYRAEAFASLERRSLSEATGISGLTGSRFPPRFPRKFFPRKLL